MNSIRFQDAKRIYSAALERDPDLRAAYVAETCAGDEGLRKEVESLLGCRNAAQEFFQAPAIEAGAKALARNSSADLHRPYFLALRHPGEDRRGRHGTALQLNNGKSWTLMISAGQVGRAIAGSSTE